MDPRFAGRTGLPARTAEARAWQKLDASSVWPRGCSSLGCAAAHFVSSHQQPLLCQDCLFQMMSNAWHTGTPTCMAMSGGTTVPPTEAACSVGSGACMHAGTHACIQAYAACRSHEHSVYHPREARVTLMIVLPSIRKHSKACWAGLILRRPVRRS
jgi:hypothetical protein